MTDKTTGTGRRSGAARTLSPADLARGLPALAFLCLARLAAFTALLAIVPVTRTPMAP